MGVFVLEGIRTITLLCCVQILFRKTEKKADVHFVIHCIILCAAFLLLKTDRELHPVLQFIVKMCLLMLHTKLYYRKETVWICYHLFLLYVLWEMIYLASAVLGYRLSFWLKIEPNSCMADTLLIGEQVLLNLIMLFVFQRKQWRLPFQMSLTAKAGILLIGMVLELIFLWFCTMQYKQAEIQNYGMLLAEILFECVVFLLWILDKQEEEKKIRELTSYAHRTREIIPSMGRALSRMQEMPECFGESEQILEELRSICQIDGEETKRKSADIKTFASTGCILLDEQLERYLEEACECGFHLDLIVRAPVDGLLQEKWIDRYQLLQLIGDLYRNAYHVIEKYGKGGYILICFGYNREGFYEISIYDSGESFPEYIIRHLGERGVTTDGTGHGLADIFEILEQSRGSFILDQDMEEYHIYTKGIRIVFDGEQQVVTYGKHCKKRAERLLKI